MTNNSVNSKIVSKDKSVTITEVGNGFIMQFSETIHYVNGKSSEMKQVLISALLHDTISKVKTFFEGVEKDSG